MRGRVLTLVLWASLAASTAAIPYVPAPRPVYEAPIDRALENVAAMEGLEPAHREALLGRLNLLAYARDDAAFTYVQENNRLHEAGSVLCSQAPGRSAAPPREFGPEERCARLDFTLSPQKELPASAPSAPSTAARLRLEAARSHYDRAIALDGRNLRARLGHAYVLDRLGWVEAARSELREIVRIARPLLARERLDWERHAVLSEAVMHLRHLPQTDAERRDLAHLQARLDATASPIPITPIVVPLTDAQFAQLIDRASPVAFDFAGTGDTRAQGWLSSDAAWLVWDPEQRGDIRSGFNLIGQRTWAVFWSDGFEAMRSLDDNGDGELAGAELGGLALWRDADSDGVSDPGEVRPLAAYDVTALAVRGAREREGLLVARGGVRLSNGRTRPLYDWTPGLNSAPNS